MPQIDQLDFLLSRTPALERNVIFVYQRTSRFLKCQTFLKIVRVLEERIQGFVTVDPNVDSADGVGLFGDTFQHIIDLSFFDDCPVKSQAGTEAAVGIFLRAIADGSRTDSGLFLIVPARTYCESSGPVWLETGWSIWPAVAKLATVIAEPIVAVENVRSTVEKLMKLSDLPSMSLIRNAGALVAYLERYVEDGAPTLLEISHQLDTSVLIGVDPSTRIFDARALEDDETGSIDAPSIGASLRSFLADPEPRRLRDAVGALDERLNSRSIAVSDALQQLYRASTMHISASDHYDRRLVLWAWLLLECEAPPSKGALIDAYLGMVKRYRAFCISGAVGPEQDFPLDPVLNAWASDRGDEASSLNRAKGALADSLVKYVGDQSGATVPHWLSRLELALDLERSMKE